MLLGLEVAGKSFATGWLRFPLRAALGLGLLGRLGTRLERPALLRVDDGRSRRWWRLCHGASLALLALRYGEQLSDALVESSQLLDELRDLIAKRGILSS